MEKEINRTYTIVLTEAERIQLCDEFDKLFVVKSKLSDYASMSELYQLLHNER